MADDTSLTFSKSYEWPAYPTCQASFGTFHFRQAPILDRPRAFVTCSSTLERVARNRLSCETSIVVVMGGLERLNSQELPLWQDTAMFEVTSAL